jgi:hypothetical protein
VNSRSWRRRGDSICQERIKTIPMTDPAAASHQESEKSPLRSIYSPIAGLPARSCWWRLWCMSQHAIQKDSFCSCEDSSGFVLFILACRTDYLLAHRRTPRNDGRDNERIFNNAPAGPEPGTHSFGFTGIHSDSPRMPQGGPANGLPHGAPSTPTAASPRGTPSTTLRKTIPEDS